MEVVEQISYIETLEADDNLAQFLAALKPRIRLVIVMSEDSQWDIA